MSPRGDVIRATGERCAQLLGLHEALRRARAANDNDCAGCLVARRRGGYVCPQCAGRGVLW